MNKIFKLFSVTLILIVMSFLSGCELSLNDVEKTYKMNIGIILNVVGLISLSVFPLYGGTHFKDFISGALFGGSLSLILLGITIIILHKRKK